jgi:4a-hydroxytetrahydrobiopterin dehydratase
VQGVGELAEAEGGTTRRSASAGATPRYATVSLQTKKIKGLHENDVILAAKIDRLAGGAGPRGDREGPSPSA